MYAWANAQQTSVVRISDGAVIPTNPKNADYADFLAWVAQGNQAAPLVFPAPTIADVRAEAQRRIVALVGATDIQSCLIKQLNANMRANELNDIRHERELTAGEAAEAAALRGLADQIKAIRAASNLLEPNPPADFTADTHWP